MGMTSGVKLNVWFRLAPEQRQQRRPALAEPSPLSGRFVAQTSGRKVPKNLPSSLDDEWAEF